MRRKSEIPKMYFESVITHRLHGLLTVNEAAALCKISKSAYIRIEKKYMEKLKNKIYDNSMIPHLSDKLKHW